LNAKKKQNEEIRLTRDHIFLDAHDEEKVLLFTAGILFGVGASVSVFMNTLWYGGLAAIALGSVLLLIEKRQR